MGGSVAPADGIVGGRTESLNDGAAYSPETGVWRSVPPPPFDELMFGLKGIYAAGVITYIGTECNDIAEENDQSPICSPGTSASAVYDLRDDSWREVNLPPELAEIGVGTLGAAEDTAIFTERQTHYVYNPGDDSWQKLPAPPLTPRVTCITAGGLASVGFTDEAFASGEGGEGTFVLPDPALLTIQPKSSTLALPAEQWSALSLSPLDAPAPRVSRGFCAGQNIVVLPSDNDGSNIALRFAVDDNRWSQIPLPPVTLGANPLGTWTGSELVVWGNTGPAAYDLEANEWRQVETTRPPPTADTKLVWVEDRVVVARPTDGGVQLETLDI